MGRKELSILSLALAMTAGACSVGCDGVGQGSEFIAKGASFGRWEDKRASGSIIMHDMLILTEPRESGSEGAPLGFYVVTTQGTMASKLDDIVMDRVPSMRGVTMNFAVGAPVSVKVERVIEGGKRQLVREGRASFLEVTR